MANFRNHNVTVTAPTAVERVEKFVIAYGTYAEAITSHRDYEYPHGAVRTVTRTPLLTADLIEILRLARIGAEVEALDTSENM